ncbi:MAG: TIGR01777 family protein, partial [Armatimonadetes bacterium]|nr:TIGR01777 family protein [Akkermansiaceae bacterium]
SRIGVTAKIVKRISSLPEEERPGVLLNASAVGIYGNRGDELLKEGAPQGEGYLADLCAAWENAADEAVPLGVRVVKLRIGVVLGKGGRAFEKLLAVFKAGIGGRLGNGKQWMPWIHVEDLRRAMLFCLLNEELSGAVNGTAPLPERNVELTGKLAGAVGRRVFLPVPEFALKLALGGFGGALLAGQRALPVKLVEAGFEFRYRKLEEALEDLTS